MSPSTSVSDRSERADGSEGRAGAEASRRYVAGVDLGSHTFAVVVARSHGAGAGFRTVDVVKERVALMRGVDEETGEISRAALDRALAAVGRIGARLRGLERDDVRVVGTSALRVTPGLGAFRQTAQELLGAPIEVIDGDREASLVFTGVAYGGVGSGRRLVVDLGGGSTECAIGTGLEPSVTASLPFGHLERTRKIAERGRLDGDAYAEARAEVLAGWSDVRARWGSERARFVEAIGSGGTIRAIRKVLRERGKSRGGEIAREDVADLEDELLDLGDQGELDWDGLSERRRPTFAGGVLAVSAFLEAFGIARLRVSDYGLRDGLLHELLGHSTKASLRHLTVQRLERRYGVDRRQGERVRATALELARQLGGIDDEAREMLQFAARLHELGGAFRYKGYHKQGGRVIRRTELTGFTRDDQMSLAALIRLHRPAKKIKNKHWRRVTERRRPEVIRATLALRLAALLRRTRVDEPVPVRLEADLSDEDVTVTLPRAWLRERPLLVADLQQEERKWKQKTDWALDVRYEG